MSIRRTCLLRDLTKTLVPVLEELAASELARRPFVVVEEPITKSFVQFARIVKEIPERTAAKLGEVVLDVPKFRIDLESFGGDPLLGAMRACDILHEGFGLPLDAELVILVDGDPAN